MREERASFNALAMRTTTNDKRRSKTDVDGTSKTLDNQKIKTESRQKENSPAESLQLVLEEILVDLGEHLLLLLEARIVADELDALREDLLKVELAHLFCLLDGERIVVDEHVDCRENVLVDVGVGKAVHVDERLDQVATRQLVLEKETKITYLESIFD